MKNGFDFERIRASARKENQLVIEGCYLRQSFEGKKVAARFRVKDGNGERYIKLNSENIVTTPLFSKLQDEEDPKAIKKIYILIDIPAQVKPGELQIVLCGAGAEQVICAKSARKVKRALEKVNGFLDDIILDSGNMRIRGWVASEQAVPVKLDTKKAVEQRLTWYKRGDVNVFYPELNPEHKTGFLLEARADNKPKVVVEYNGRRKRLRRNPASYGRLCVFFVSLPSYTIGFFRSLSERGISGTKRKIQEHFKRNRVTQTIDYGKWKKLHDPGEDELARQRKHIFDYNPRFSIVVPLYETDEKMLGEMIASVSRQTYSNWELCLSDGSHNDKRLEGFLKSYTDRDGRIRYTAGQDGPLGISENTNQALGIATGEYIVLGDHDDVFAENMLYECVAALNRDRDIDVLYSDEDKTDMKGNEFFDPNFKPDFNIDLLRANNYICHVFVVRKDIVDRIGGFRSEFDGAQDYDFILRCVEQTENICHMPQVLYHWRSHLGSTADMPEAKMYAFEAGKHAIEEHYRRVGEQAAVDYGDDLGFYRTRYEIKGNPLISIVIPNKDHIDDLKKCMDSIDRKSDYRNLEYVIVENNSTEAATFEFYKEMEKRDNVKVVYWKGEFNFSAINNYGAEYAEGEYLLLLNNDTEIINEDCLSQMLGYCQRDDVGIVGARLYYPDGSVQHAGVIVGMGGIAGHAFVGLDESDGLYQSRTKVACDYSAVTAACMMVKKSVFEQVGGLEEKFKVAFNDIDFCMKVRETGKLVVYNANAKLYHYESKSRGLEDTPEKQERFQGEIQMFQERWPEILIKGDPYYNRNLTLDKSDFSLKE